MQSTYAISQAQIQGSDWGGLKCLPRCKGTSAALDCALSYANNDIMQL